MQLTPLIRLHDGRSVASIAPILILSADERVLSQSYSPKLGHFSVSVQEPFLAFWCQMRTRPSTHTVRFEHRRSRRLTLLGLVSPVSPRLSLSLVVLEDRPHLRIELSRDHNSFLTLNAGIVGHPISELAVPSLSFDPYHPEFVILWYTRGSWWWMKRQFCLVDRPTARIRPGRLSPQGMSILTTRLAPLWRY
jgi:hypothetical protein